MKKQFLIVFALVLTLSSFRSNYPNDIIELPIRFVYVFGGLNYAYGEFTGDIPEESPWYKTKYKVSGIPEDWNEVQTENVWLDPYQFVFQNYKQGNLPDMFFDFLKTKWEIDLNNRMLSEKPIKCFVHVIYEKDKNGNIKYKVDTNNNLDFSDETEYTAFQMNGISGKNKQQVDSIMENLTHTINYEALRNGKVVDLKAPLLIVNMIGSLNTNFPQYAETEFMGTKILIASQDFGSTNYDPATIYLESNKEYGIKKNEFIPIGGELYQNLGVDINRQVLKLKRIEKGNMMYSSQVGLYAIPFSDKDFITQEEISLDLYKGKYLFLDFWGSWCGPCVSELPSMKQAYQNLDKTKIEFLGIAKDNAESLRIMLKKKKIEWKQILCEKEEGIIGDYNITGYPTNFLIDPNGKIIAKDLRGENLLETLNYYIKQN